MGVGYYMTILAIDTLTFIIMCINLVLNSAFYFQKCNFCGKLGATIGCAIGKCKKVFMQLYQLRHWTVVFDSWISGGCIDSCIVVAA